MAGWVIAMLAGVLAASGAPLFAVIMFAAFAAICFASSDATMGQLAALLWHSSPAIAEGELAETMSPAASVLLEAFRISDVPEPIAIPLFTLAGAIMTRGGMSRRLVDVAKAATSFMPGGLAAAAIMACAFFAALSGSSAVTIIAIGGIIAPALMAAGYGERFSLGLLTSCGAIGILAPPSLPLIIFGVIGKNVASPGSDLDINKLFIAGTLPIVLTVVAFTAYSAVSARRAGIVSKPVSWLELGAALRRGVFALALPVLLLGGIYGGITTVLEASVVAVLYAGVVEIFVHRELRLADLMPVAYETLELVGGIFIILLAAMGFTYFLTDAMIPDAAAEWIRQYVETRAGFLLAVNILLLVIGCLMDIFSAIVVIAPLIVPMAESFGVNLIHLGIIFTFNLEIGFATPPFGLNLFIASGFFRKPAGEVFRASVPFLAILLGILFLISYVEDITLWPVRLAESLTGGGP